MVLVGYSSDSESESRGSTGLPAPKKMKLESTPTVPGFDLEAMAKQLGTTAQSDVLKTPIPEKVTETETKTQKDLVCVICPKKSRYTCPACSKRSCSVECCNKHKDMFACTGKRNVTAFVDKKSFRDVDFRIDIHFLETAQREIDVNIQAAHSVLRKNVLSEQRNSNSRLNDKLNRLRAVLRKNNTELLLLPSTFERHLRNRSRCNKNGMVHWSVEVQGESVYHNVCADNTWLVEFKKLGLDLDGNALQKLSKVGKCDFTFMKNV